MSIALTGNSSFFMKPTMPSVNIYLPNTIQQDIHPDIRIAGNSPDEFSAGTYFYLYTRESRIMIKMTPIPQNGIPKVSKISN